MTEPIPYTLHILPTPDSWGLPTLDPSCLVAILLLQMTVPGQFCLVPTTDFGASPSGSLPYLSHSHRTVSSVQSIVKYAASSAAPSTLPPVDSGLGPVKRAQKNAWCSHVDLHMGNIVAYALYASNINWRDVTHPALSDSLPFLHRQFAGHLRDAFRSRLEDANLWIVEDEAEEEPKSFAERQKKQKEKMPFGQFKETFGRAKVVQVATSSFDIYATMLGSKPYFFGDRPTTLDVHLAAHVIILTTPSYPDAFLKELLIDMYPTLVQHAQRVEASIFPLGYAVVSRKPNAQPGLAALIPRLNWRSLRNAATPRSDTEKSFDRARWLWYAGAVLGTITYIVLFMPIRLVVVRNDEGIEENTRDRETSLAPSQGAENDDDETEVDEEEVDEEEWTTHG